MKIKVMLAVLLALAVSVPMVSDAHRRVVYRGPWECSYRVREHHQWVIYNPDRPPCRVVHRHHRYYYYENGRRVYVVPGYYGRPHVKRNVTVKEQPKGKMEMKAPTLKEGVNPENAKPGNAAPATNENKNVTPPSEGTMNNNQGATTQDQGTKNQSGPNGQQAGPSVQGGPSGQQGGPSVQGGPSGQIGPNGQPAPSDQSVPTNPAAPQDQSSSTQQDQSSMPQSNSGY